MIVIPFSKIWVDSVLFLILIFWIINSSLGKIHFEKKPLNIAVALMSLSIIVSFFINLNKIQSSSFGMIIQIKQFLNLLAPLILYFIVSTLPITTEKVKLLLKVLLISSFCAISYLLILSLKTPYSMVHRLFISNYGPNDYGCLLAEIILMVIIFIFFQKNKYQNILLSVLLFLLLIALIFTYSRGAWIGLIGGFIGLYFTLNKKMKIKLFIALIILGIIYFFVSDSNLELVTRVESIFSTDTGSNAQRVIVWKTALKMIPISPVFGIGPFMFSDYFKKINPQNWDYMYFHAHNNFLTILVEMGIVGLLAFINLMIFSFIEILDLKKSQNPFQKCLALITLAWFWVITCHGMIDYIFWVKPFTMFMLLLGMLTSLKNNQAPIQ